MNAFVKWDAFSQDCRPVPSHLAFGSLAWIVCRFPRGSLHGGSSSAWTKGEQSQPSCQVVWLNKWLHFEWEWGAGSHLHLCWHKWSCVLQDCSLTRQSCSYQTHSSTSILGPDSRMKDGVICLAKNRGLLLSVADQVCSLVTLWLS